MTKRKVLAVVSACALLLTMFVSLIPVYAGKPDDTTGWTLGEGSTISGNADYGWSLNQAGCNQDRQAKFQNKYETDISLRDLQMQFVANYAAAGLWTINLSDKDMNPLPGVNDLGETGLCLILEKRNDSVLAVQRWSNGAPGAAGGVYLYANDISFDFTIPHTLHFVERDGKWYVALDNTVFEADGMDVTSILAAMDGKRVIMESLSDPSVNFPYINFADAKKTADWNYTSQVAVAGSEERGFTMIGKEGGDGYAVYGKPVSLLNNEFQVRLDFDSNWAYFGFDLTNDGQTHSKLNADIDMQFYYKDGRMDIGLFSGGGYVTDKLYSKENFDFDAVHVFGFVEEDGKYYLTVDGEKASYNEVLSNHVAEMKDSAVYWRVGAGNGSTVQYFTDIKVLGWNVGEGSALAGGNAAGWQLQQSADTGKPSSYQTGYSLKDLQIKFTASYNDNVWINLNIGTAQINALPNKSTLDAAKGMSFILEKKGDDGSYLRFQRWSSESAGGPYLATTDIKPLDFSQEHIFHFAEKDGRYYPAIDDTLLDTDVTEIIQLYENDPALQPMVTLLSCDAVSFSALKFAEVPHTVIGGWNVNDATVTGDAANGYTVTGGAGAKASYRMPIDLSAQSVRMRFTHEAGKWQGISFNAVDDTPTGVESPTADKLTLILGRDGDELRASVFLASGEGCVVRIPDFAWDEEHAIGFTKVRDNWYLNIDGVVYTAPAEDSKGITAAVNTALNNMAAKNTYVTVMSEGQTPLNVSGFRFVETTVNEDPSSDWKLNGSATIEGDATNGFTLVGDRGVEAKYQKAINLSTQSVRLKFNHTAAWQAVNFTTTSDPTGLLDASADNLTMLLSFNGETTLRVSVWLGGNEAESAIAYIDNFDRNAEHTIGFTKRENNWYLNFDGVVYTAPAEESKGITARLTQALNNMSANTAYAGLHSAGGEQGTEINVSGFRFVDTTVSQVGDWRLSGTVTIQDNGENGFNLAGGGGAQTKYQKPINLSAQSVKLQLNHTGEWQGINFTTSRETNGVTNPSENALTLILGREGNELRASIWIGDVAGGQSQGEGCVVRIPDFAWNAEHAFGFSKVEDSWYLNIDGRVYTEPLEGSKGITSYVTAALENMVTVPTYAGVISAGGVDLAITGYRYVTTETPEVQTDWRLSGTVTAEGDATNGYDVAGNGQATYKTPLKLGEQSVTMTFDPGVGNWLALSFGPDDGFGGLADLTENQFALVITHGNGTEIPDTSLRVSLWNSEISKEEAIVIIDNFDFTAEHSFGFSKVDNNWYLNVDGKLYTTAEASVTEKLTKVLDNIAQQNSFAGMQASSGTLAISGFRFTATQHPSDDSDWKLSGEAKAEGDRENGYALSGNGYAAYKVPFDMATWSVKMQFVPTVGGWQSLTFSDICTVDTNVLPGLATQGGEHNALTFILGRGTGNEGDAATTDLRLSLYMTYMENGEEKQAERAIAYISEFDWNAEHTFGFAKIGDSWYVVVDGKTYTSPQADGADRLITNAITEVLNAMQGKDAYVRAFASDALSMPKFNLAETGLNEKEEGEWDLTTDMTAEKTGSGWTVSGIPGIAGWKEVFAVDKDIFRMQFKPEVGEWTYFSIGDTYSVSAEQFMNPGNANNMICFILGRENETTLRLSMWNEKEYAMVYLSNFDFDKTHDFQFVQRRGNWYLSIDGRAILAPQGDGEEKIITSWITEAVNNLKGKEAYVRVSASAGKETTMTGIQMIGEGHDNSSGSQTGVVFPIAAVAALGVSFLAVLVLRKKKQA